MEQRVLPLREKASRNQNDESMSVSLGSYQFHPIVGFNLLFESEGISNLNVFTLHHLIVHISVCVDLGENIQRLLFLALVDQKTRAFGNEEDETDLQDAWS